MKVKPEQQEKAFSKASQVQKELYSSADSGEVLHNICLTQNIIDKKIPFFIAVGDVILDLVPQEKLPELLVERLGIDQPKAMQLTADLLDFLAPLKSEKGTPVPIKTDVNTSNDNNLAAEIAEAEAAMNTVQPMRTMSHDMDVVRSVADEPVHNAPSQEEILDRSATVKDKNPEATWGTAQN